MKKLFFITQLLCVCTMVNAQLPFDVQIKSTNHQLASGGLYLDVILSHSDSSVFLGTSLTFTDSFHSNLYTTSPSSGLRDSLDADSLHFVLIYDTITRPYFQRTGILTIRYIVNADTIDYQDLVTIYFTPYGTVEIMSQQTMAGLNRMWEKPYKPEPTRVYIPQSSIPVSNIGSNDTLSPFDSTYQIEKLEGLAYAVLMKPISTSIINQYYDSINAAASIAFIRTFDGRIKGHIKTTIINDEGQTLDVPVIGALVYVAETRGFTSVLKETHTDDNGYYELNYSAVRFGISELPLEIHVVAQNREFSERVEVIEVEYYLGGNEKKRYPTSSRIDLGKVEMDADITRDLIFSASERKERDAFFMLSWAVMAKKMIKNELNWSFDKKLQIYPGADGSYYYSTREKGNETIGDNYCQWKKLAVVEIVLLRGDANHESTIQHEFMHYLMDYMTGWQLNVEDGILGAADVEHRADRDVDQGIYGGNFNWQMAYNEGFATGLAGVLDVYYKNYDNEWRRHSLVENPQKRKLFDFREDLNRELLNNGAGGNTLTNEYHFANALFDLYDGPSHHNRTNNTTVASEYNDMASPTAVPKDITNPKWEPEEVDNLELSLAQILNPIVTFNNIESIDDYYRHLLNSFSDCETRRKIRKVFIQNRIGLESLTYEANQNYIGSDDIGYLVPADELKICSKNGSNVNATHNFGIDKHYLQDLHSQNNLSGKNSMPVCDELVVKSGGILYFNLNGDATLIQKICANLVLLSGGQVQVGRPINTLVQNANITVSSGSILQTERDNFNNSPKIHINNNSHLIIEEGATLRIGPGTQIILDGPNALLEIRGNLIIEDGATFAPTGGPNGQGFVRFNTTGVWNGATAIAKVDVGVNSSMTFEATNGNTKVLEIAGSSLWIDDKNNTNFVFTLKNATAEISHNGMLNLGCRAVFDGATVQKMASAGHYRGVYLWAKPFNVVKNSTFKEASSGLQFSSTKWGIRLNVENTNFINNYNGLTVHGGGLTLDKCNASDNNGHGVLAYGLKLPGEINLSTLNTNLERGLTYESNSGAPLAMEKNTFQDNPNAMKFISTGDLSLICNQFLGVPGFNSQTGLEFFSGSLLMSPSRFSGPNNFKDNEKNIWFQSDWNQYAKMEIDNGKNALSNKVDATDQSMAIFGIIDSRNQATVNANSNKWDNRTISNCTPLPLLTTRGCPQSNFGLSSPDFENYSINAPFGFPTPMVIGWAALNDASPQSQGDIAAHWGKPNVCDDIVLRKRRIFSGEGDIYPDEGTLIQFTSSTPKTIGTAVEDVFNLSKDTMISYAEITNKWKEILTYDGYPLPLNPVDEYYLDIASTQILSVAGHYLSELPLINQGVINDVIIQDAIQSCDYWINTLQTETGEYSLQFKNKIHLKKGHILYMAEEDVLATSQYANILSWGNTFALSEANYWLCHISKMEQLNNDPYNPILLESLPPCEWTASSTTQYKRTPEKAAPIEITETQFNIYPNPTKDYFTARFMSNGDAPVTIELLDLNGKVMTDPYLLKPFRGYNQAKILTDGIRAGTYFVKLTSNESVEFKRLILVD